MALPKYQPDEPLSPAGRLVLQPYTTIIIGAAFFFESPIDIPKLTAAFESSVILQHPRFNSILISNRNNVQKWRKTKLDLDQHIKFIDMEKYANKSDSSGTTLSSSSQVNAYLADLSVSCPLSYDKPLWEVHVLLDHKCIIFRIHHAIGDGMSLMSLFIAGCKRVDRPELLPTFIATTTSNSSNGTYGNVRSRSVFDLFKIVWFTIVFVLRFIGRVLWVKDVKTVVSGGRGVELWPRKLATARFLIDDMKTVKQAIPDCTINDVLFGIVSLGLSKYLDLRSQNALPEGLQLTGMAMVNLRKQPGLQELTNMMKSKSKSRWGNKFGALLLPVYYHKPGSDPLQYIYRAKAMIDQKKQSLEAQFTYIFGDLVMSLFGAKFTSWLNHRVFCNTTFTISNLAGPKEEMTFGGNKITSARVNASTLPHAIVMHMLSYAGKAEMQILTTADIIPDPEILADLYEKALAEMKVAAAAIQTDKSQNEEHC